MQKALILTFIALFLLFGCAEPQTDTVNTQQIRGVTGCWKGSFESQGTSLSTFTVNINQSEAGVLFGNIQAFGKGSSVIGSIEGNALNFSFNNSEKSYSFKGSVLGDNVSGSWESDSLSGSWNASRGC